VFINVNVNEDGFASSSLGSSSLPAKGFSRHYLATVKDKKSNEHSYSITLRQLSAQAWPDRTLIHTVLRKQLIDLL